MYPQGIYGNPLRPGQLALCNAFFDNTPIELEMNFPYTPEQGEELRKLGSAEGMLALIRSRLRNLLPAGCPFVIGGGFVRDGIFGAAIADVDIWLPSNMADCQEASQFAEWLDVYYGGESTTIFNRPEELGEYRGLVNHWVVEAGLTSSVHGDNARYQVQFMRTNVEWTGDVQEYFNGLLRQFDFDMCMMFLAWESDNSSFGISPNGHYLICERAWWDNARRGSSGYKMNPLRENNSPRTASRHDKMQNKYFCHYSGVMDHEPVAVPVLLAEVMQLVNSRSDLYAPRPVVQTQTEGTDGNAIRQHDGEEAPRRELE